MLVLVHHHSDGTPKLIPMKDITSITIGHSSEDSTYWVQVNVIDNEIGYFLNQYRDTYKSCIENDIKPLAEKFPSHIISIL